MSKNTAPAARVAELEAALELLDRVDLILNAAHVAADPSLLAEVDAAESHLTDLTTAVQGLQASLQAEHVAR